MKPPDGEEPEFSLGITRGEKQQTGKSLEKRKAVIPCPEETEQDRPLEEVVGGDVWGDNLQQDRVAIVYAQSAVIGCRILKDSHATK